MIKIKPIVSVLVLVLLVVPFVASADSNFAQPSLTKFDEDVAVCRRLIRHYCAIVQEMAKGTSIDSEKKQKALDSLKEGAAKWAEIQKKYTNNPPLEYSTDPQFKARLQDMSNAVDDMLRALTAGEPRRSLLACGFGCGLCVTMHEENGLVYGLDRLFHLRKTAKTAESMLKSGHWEETRALIPQILKQRDQVFLAPVPWPQSDNRNSQYLESLKELSQACDDLALAATRNDREKARQLLDSMVSVINKPYGLAL